MEENRTQEQVTPRKLRLREKTLAYVVDHQEHSIIVPIILTVILIAALIFIGVSDRKNVLAYSSDTKAHSSANDDLARYTFAGDIVLGRNVTVRAEDVGYDKLFAKMQKLWENSDMVMANLDSCVIEGDVDEYEKLAQKKAYFYTDRSKLSSLKEAGIDVLSIATDHIADYGRSTIRTCIDELDSLGILHVGAGIDRECAAQYHIAEVTTASGKTVKIAIFGALGHQDDKFGARAMRTQDDDSVGSDLYYSDFDDIFTVPDEPVTDNTISDDTAQSDVTGSDYDPWEVTAGTFSGRNQMLIDSINDVRSQVDCVVVYIHWGDDKMFVESNDMRELAHTYIDAGADIIIGTNPRVLLPVETYKSNVKTGYIFYSIGSLVYDDAESRVCDSMLLDLVIDEDMNKRLEITPLRIDSAIPGETVNGFYTKRIFAQLTKNLDKSLCEYDGNKLIITMN